MAAKPWIETCLSWCKVKYSAKFSASKSGRNKANTYGFTLVELLVVIAIIGVLIALLLPAVQAAREAARRSQCSNNVKQTGVAFHNYHGAYNKLPTGFVHSNPGQVVRSNNATWALYLLPYMEEQAIYDKCDFNGGFGGSASPEMANYIPNTTPIASMQCPSNPSGLGLWLNLFAYRSYAANNGIGPMVESTPVNRNNRPHSDRGVFYMDSSMGFSDILDGTSKTLFVSEIANVRPQGTVGDQRGVQYAEGSFYHHNHTPNSSSPDQIRTGSCVSTPRAPCTGTFPGWNNRQLVVSARSNHTGGVNVLMGDGSIHFVSDNVALNVWRSVGTPVAIADEVIFGGFN